MSEELDIGHGHTIRRVGWHPDRELNPQYADRPDIEWIGVIIHHPRPDNGEPCSGLVTFDLPGVAELVGPDRPLWTVASFEPLTTTPSVLCRICGDHGYITDGAWVPC